MLDDPTVWSYIARETVGGHQHPIGTVIAATVDIPERAKDNARIVAEWMRDGLTIERVPVEWVRQHFLSTEPYRAETETPDAR